MIVTVTMNPAIDKTVEIERLRHGGLNRIQKVEYDAGGKGINVSKTIRELGGKSVAMGFLAGNSGKTIANVLGEKGIENDFVWVEGETRTNTKVYEKDGTLTELNEPGPAVTEAAVEKLLEKLEEYAGKDTLFVLSGSIPDGVPKDIYARITRRVHEKGSRVLVDADGELFRIALEARPDMIKPNRVELEELFGLAADACDEELWKAARSLQNQGIETIAVSMGKEGAMFFIGEYQAKCPALSVKIHSTVGAGDAMVAALAYAWEQKTEKEKMVRMCMAVSAGAVMTVGTKPPSAELVETLKKQVEIENIV
ncbi:MAG: 1-phosphofructokinase [Clostridia bacterium]|nr:1-phosphofructokinase [Clostridia bacterium]